MARRADRRIGTKVAAACGGRLDREPRPDRRGRGPAWDRSRRRRPCRVGRSGRTGGQRPVPAPAGPVGGVQRGARHGSAPGARRAGRDGGSVGAGGDRGMARRAGHPGRGSRGGRPVGARRRSRCSAGWFRVPSERAVPGRRPHAAGAPAGGPADRCGRGRAGGGCGADRGRPLARCDDAAPDAVLRARIIVVRYGFALFVGDPDTLPRGTALLIEAADGFHGHDAALEQRTLLTAFESCAVADRLMSGVTLPALGERLAAGAELLDGPTSVILRGLSAMIRLPYDQAVPPVRAAMAQIVRLDDHEMMQMATAIAALTTFLSTYLGGTRLWTGRRKRRGLLGLSRRWTACCGSSRWPSSPAAACTERAAASRKCAASGGRWATTASRSSTPPCWLGPGRHPRWSGRSARGPGAVGFGGVGAAGNLGAGRAGHAAEGRRADFRAAVRTLGRGRTR